MEKKIKVEYKKCQLETPISLNNGMSITEGMCMEATDGVLYLYSEVPFLKDDFDKEGNLIYSAPHYGELKRNIINQIEEMKYPREWFVFENPTDYLEITKNRYLKRMKICERNGEIKSEGWGIWKQKFEEINTEIENHKDQGWTITEREKIKNEYLKMLDEEMEMIEIDEI